METCSIDGQDFCCRQSSQLDLQTPHSLGSNQSDKKGVIVDICTHHVKFGVVGEGTKFHGGTPCRGPHRNPAPEAQTVYLMNNVVCPRSSTTTSSSIKEVSDLPSKKVQSWATSSGASQTSKVTNREIRKSERISNEDQEEEDRSVISLPKKIGLLSGHIPLEPPYFVGQTILNHQTETTLPHATLDKDNPENTSWDSQNHSLDNSKRSVSTRHSKDAMIESISEESISYSLNKEERLTFHSPEGSMTRDVPNKDDVPRKNSADSLHWPPLFGKELSTTTEASDGGSTQSFMQNNDTPLSLPILMDVLKVSLLPEVHVCGGNDEIFSQGMAIENSNTKTVQDIISCTSYRKSTNKFLSYHSGVPLKTPPKAMVDKGPHHTKYALTESGENSTKVNHLGLFRRPCNELVSNANFQEHPAQMISYYPKDPYKNLAAVVIDTGTGYSKCGLAGEERTRAVVPTRVGIHRNPEGDKTPYYITEDAEAACSTLIRGVVTDWDALEVLWSHIFYSKLCIEPQELAVLVADSPVSPCTNREKVAELLFEHFEVPAMQTVHQALLTLYAYGRTTGLVIGSGHGTSYVAPIITGELEPLNIYRLDVAGEDLSEYLSQLLLAGGQPPPKADVLANMKETCCYVALNMVSELYQLEGKYRLDFVLPDKHVLSLGAERFRCPEILFKPDILGLSQPSLPQLAQISISQLEPYLQERLLANVVLEGGTTMLNGFSERVQQDLGPTARVFSLPHRAIASWLGGSIMASLDSFQSLWLSRGEYQEEGSWAIYKYRL